MILSKEVKKLEDSKVSVFLRISRDYVREKYNELLRTYSQKIKLQGFRVGKIPFSIVETKYASELRDATLKEVITKSIDNLFNDIPEKPLHYATPRIIDENIVLDLDKDFEFTIEYEIYPIFEIPNFDDIEIKLPLVTVREDDIDKELKNLQEQNSVILEDLEGIVKEGSIISVDFVELSEDNIEIASTKREGFVCTIGEANNYYDFDAEIIGMRTAEQKTVYKEYDDTYKFRELSGKLKKISVKIKNVKKKEVPILDNNFAKNISDKFDTLEDLRKHIRVNFEQFVMNRKNDFKFSKLFSELTKRIEIKPPKTMIEAEIESAWKHSVINNNIPREQAKEQFKLFRDSIDKTFESELVENLKSKLIFQEIIAQDSFEVGELELEEELRKQAENSRLSYQELKKYYEEQRLIDYLKYEIKKRKVKAKILEKVKESAGEDISVEDFMSYGIGD